MMIFGISVYADENIDENIFEAKESGIVFTIPNEYKDAKGYIKYCDYGDISMYGKGIVRMAAFYNPLSEEEYNRREEELTAAQKNNDLEKFSEISDQDYSLDLFRIYGINEGRGTEELIDFLVSDTLPEEEEYYRQLCYREIGTYDGITYILVTEDPELLRNSEPLEGFEDEYYEEYISLSENTDLIKDNIRLIGGVELKEPAVLAEEGAGIQFETTDLDGNPVKSEDLFAGHKLTMINLWATWCSPCKKELPDLDKLNQELSEEKCQIIGIVTDTDKEEKISKAKEILEEKGVTFLNLVAFDGLKDLLPNDRWPTSYFVDENGCLVGEPVIGTLMENYMEVFDSIE
jgi:thiol-disulfide isomerase/thioredoxin